MAVSHAASFSLPPELYSSFLPFILRSQDLATCCLVDTTMRAFSVPLLYREVRIYAWMQGGKSRVLKLLQTLAGSSELGRWVFVLELRDFPFLFGAGGPELEDLCGRALANTPRLHRAIWTRNSGLSDSVLTALHAVPALRALEINGGARGYSARTLLKFDYLESLVIIMPDRPVGRVLAEWLRSLASHLRELSLICKSGSGVISDRSLSVDGSGVQFPMLEKLHLTGCNVSAEAVSGMISSSQLGVTSLRLEAMHKSFNFAVLQSCAQRTHCFRVLRSLTVTFSVDSMPATISGTMQGSTSVDRSTSISHAITPLAQLIAFAPKLDELSIHPTSMPTSVSSEDPDRTSAPATARGGTAAIPQSFIEVLPPSLLSLAVNRISLGPDQLAAVCERLPRLERLYVMLGRTALSDSSEETNELVRNLSRLTKLQALHLTFPFSLDAADVLGMSNDDGDDDDDESADAGFDTTATDDTEPSGYEQVYLAIVRACPALQEFGVQNRVWKVERKYYRDAQQPDGWRTEMHLGRRENPTVAEQFLVVRI